MKNLIYSSLFTITLFSFIPLANAEEPNIQQQSAIEMCDGTLTEPNVQKCLLVEFTNGGLVVDYMWYSPVTFEFFPIKEHDEEIGEPDFVIEIEGETLPPRNPEPDPTS